MTDRVNPSFERAAESFLTASAIAGAGGSDGYVVPNADSPTKPAVVDTIDETQFDEFTVTTSGTSLSVTINGGESYIFGAWVARDDTTVVSLDANQDDQIVYLGWDHTQDDTVIIGFSSAFSSTDPRIPLYSFDTDSNGVTNVADQRPIGKDVVGEDDLTQAVTDHSNETSGVHGVSGNVAGTDYVDTSVSDHSNEDTGVHGVGASTVASTDYVDNSVLNHASLTSTHGVSGDIAGTDYVDNSVLNHASLTSTHGVSGDIAGTNYVDNSVSTHASQDSDVHGVPSSSEIASLQQVISEISDHRVNDVHSENQPPQAHNNSAHLVDYLPAVGRYSDSEAVAAINAVITDAASDLTGLDQQVNTNAGNITNLQTSQISPSDVDSRNWGDYEIQKNGTDGNGIINFKTQ